MSELLQHMPQALLDHIARGQISTAQVEANTRRLCELLDCLPLQEADKPTIRHLLQTPISINPNASFVPKYRPTNLRGVPQGSLLGLMLEYEDRASYVESLLDLGFDRSLFPDNRYFLLATYLMPVETLWLLHRHGFDAREQSKGGNNAFFAAIDANNAEKIHALTQMGVNGNQTGRVPVARGTMTVEPFQYAHDQRRGCTHVKVLEALLENGWGSISYNENKSAVASYHVLIANQYNAGMILFFKHYDQKVQQIVAQEQGVFHTLSIRDLGAFAAIGRLNHVMRPELWRGHEAMITDLYLQAPPHIQEQMSSLFSIFSAELARHHIHTPVAQWNHGIVPANKDRSL